MYVLNTLEKTAGASLCRHSALSVPVLVIYCVLFERQLPFRASRGKVRLSGRTETADGSNSAETCASIGEAKSDRSLDCYLLLRWLI